MAQFSLEKDGLENELRKIRAAPSGSAQTELLLTCVERVTSSSASNNTNSDICDAITGIHEVLGGEMMRTFLGTVGLCEGTHLLLAKSTKIMECLEVLSTLNDSKSLVTFLELLDKALRHVPDDFVQKLQISQFIQFATSHIGSSDLGLSDVSSSVVVSTLGSQLVDGRELKEMIASVLAEKLKASSTQGDSTAELRYATVLSKIMGKTDSHFGICLECGVVTSVLALCQTEDILMQVCALDLLKDIAHTVAGLKYLFTQGVVEWLLTLTGGGGGGGDDPILSAGALAVLSEVFSQTMHASAEILEDPSFAPSHLDASFLARILHAITHKFETLDDSGRLSALHAIANFACTSPESLRMVVDDADTVDKWLGLVNTAKMEIKAACLHSVARVLESHVTAASSTQDVKLRLLESLGRIKDQPVVTYLVAIARQPMDEMRHAAMDVLRAIAKAGGWGLELLYMSRSSASSGFKSFLENRATEHCKDGRDVKYDIMLAIAANPSFSLLQEEIKSHISRMLNEGPYFQPTRVIVSTAEM